MGKRSRAKGKRGQLEARDLLIACGWAGAHTEGGAQRALSGAAVPDVDAPGLPVRVEVKCGGENSVTGRATLDLLAAFRQAARDSDLEGFQRWPCVLARIAATTGKRDDPCKQWMAVVPAEHYLRTLVLAHRVRR